MTRKEAIEQLSRELKKDIEEFGRTDKIERIHKNHEKS